MAGYVFSNKKLRTELMDAKDASEAAKVLGKHLSSDGQKVAKEVQQLAKEHDLDGRVAEGKKYVQEYYSSAKDEVQKFIGAKAQEASRAASRAKKNVVRKMKSARR